MARKWDIWRTYKWDMFGLLPTDPNLLLTSWDIQATRFKPGK